MGGGGGGILFETNLAYAGLHTSGTHQLPGIAPEGNCSTPFLPPFLQHKVPVLWTLPYIMSELQQKPSHRGGQTDAPTMLWAVTTDWLHST